MIVRALDADHDWTFGSGLANYYQANSAIVQNINTRLNSFLGNCFFDLNSGIDWFNLLGSKNEASLQLYISTQILKSEGVTGINQLLVDLDHSTRGLTVQYEVQTIYSTVNNTFVYDSTIG